MSKKRIISTIILIFILYLIISLSQNIWRWRQAGGEIVKAEQKLKSLAREEYLLNQRLRKIESEKFVEKEVRDKLHLVKPGEEVVLLPKVISGSEGVIKPPKMEVKENWELWKNKFF